MSARSRTAPRTRSLSASRTDTNTVPDSGRMMPDADLALGEGDGEVAVDAHDLARGAHLGAEDGVDAGEAGEREHGLLDGDVAAASAAFRPKLASGAPAMMRAAMPAIGLADDLGDERHGAADARGLTSRM